MSHGSWKRFSRPAHLQGRGDDSSTPQVLLGKRRRANDENEQVDPQAKKKMTSADDVLKKLQEKILVLEQDLASSEEKVAILEDAQAEVAR